MLRDKIILLVGKSGSGKSSVANALNARYGLTSIESYTTRPPRFNGETGHIFVSKENFPLRSEWVAWTLFNGYEYCATKQQVDENDVYIIDPAGVEYFKDRYDGNKKPIVIYLSATEDTCRTHMIHRGDSPLDVADRLLNDKKEFANAEDIADYVVDVNKRFLSDIATSVMRYVNKV